MIQRPPRRPLANDQSPKTTLASVVPLESARRIGGRHWRKAKGLLNWRDLAAEYAAQRFIRPGALVALPEDLLHPPGTTKRKGVIVRLGRGAP